MHHHLQLSATCRLELLGPHGTPIGFGHVSVLKVANDSDFWNAAIIVMPKSAGG